VARADSHQLMQVLQMVEGLSWLLSKYSISHWVDAGKFVIVPPIRDAAVRQIFQLKLEF
jgi:hypothetical protein